MHRLPAGILASTAALALAATVAGCSGDEGVGDPVESHSAYEIDSSFDVQSDFGDSQLGSLLDMLRDMSDHDNDPGRFVVAQVIDKLPAPLSWAAEPFESRLGDEVNAVIYALAPAAADEAKGLAEGLSNAARQLETRSRLEVGIDAKGRFTGKHQLESITYAFRDQTLELTRADLGDAKLLPAVRIPVHLDEPLLSADSHFLALPLGTALDRALDRLVLPRIVSGTVDLAGLFARWFACAQVAAKMAETIGEGEATILAACVSSSGSLADQLKQRLAQLDEMGGLRLAGSAEGQADGVTFAGRGWSGGYRIDRESEARLDPARCPFTARKLP